MREFEGGLAAVVLSGEEKATLELPAGLVLPGPTGAPDGEPLSTRITLPGHTGL